MKNDIRRGQPLIHRVFAKCSRALLIVLVAVAMIKPAMTATPTLLYVATNGDDAFSGTLAEPNPSRTDGPFASLDRARDEVRRIKAASGMPIGGIVVEVRRGIYRRETPLQFTRNDSGTAEAPVVYRAFHGEEVTISGGKVLSRFQPVADPVIINRLDIKARGNVLRCDLTSLAIKELGSAAGGGVELFFQDQPMVLARWPNSGFVKIAATVGGEPFETHGRAGDRIGKFSYAGDRPSRWVGEQDLWLHGYWFWDWSDQRQAVQSIDPARRMLSLTPPYHHYGYRSGQWYYAYNALAELDEPGEWYVDRDAGVLYFWPPGPLEAGRPTISISERLLTFQDVSHVEFHGMTFEAARGTAVAIDGGSHCLLKKCVLRNLGSWAVRIEGGSEHRVAGCEVYGTGDGGIALSGGDRKSLSPAGHVAEHNRIHDYGRWNRMYRPAVSLSGVGNRVLHNLIHDAPHMAISFGGNEHVIEFNEIHHVCRESNDAGAIYSGRDWTMRGNVIRHNYLHDINGFEGRGCVGVYLDDMLCGTLIYGNVFARVTRAAFIGGGRDNVVENNIFVDCQPALHVDARAQGWASYHVDTTMTDRLGKMPYDKPPWSTRYPRLVNILEDDPAAPLGNIVARNICYGGRWDEIEARARPLVHLESNLIDEDPLFVDAEEGNFQLRENSPAFRLGFRRIPFEEIGPKSDF